MLLVRNVSGPAEAIAGTEAIYKATSFNMSNPPTEALQQINWVIKTDTQTVERFNAVGDTLRFDVPASLVRKTIRVMPFVNSPSPVVSVLSRVVSEESINQNSSNLIILSRADWGARTDLPRLGVIVDRTRRTKVFIHHTVIIDDDSTANEWESLDEVKRKMRQLQTVRQEDLGADVPYSIVAFCMSNGDLVLGEGRGIDRSGAHTRGHNTAALGISFQGDFEHQPLPAQFDSQITALSTWLRRLREEDGFVNLGTERPLGREVFGHRDVKATDCPGTNIFNRLNTIHFL
jgi:peptidoglycan recognition protein